ncbi:MAG: hypothetical protein HW421_829 [Ignavibacteria bacterium]|nr:hypothetical protein [Ignavibacteria bacterium]
MIIFVLFKLVIGEINMQAELNIIVDQFNQLEYENQEFLVDIFQKQIIEKKREKLIHEIELAESNIKAGKFKRGSVDELMRDLEDD